MKRILAFMAFAVCALNMMAQEDVYKAEMDAMDAQGEAIIQQYRDLMKKDPRNHRDSSLIHFTSATSCRYSLPAPAFAEWQSG